MDRGRLGGFITDNNYSGIQIRNKMQREHLERLAKIKKRKPGSGTLDNNPPVVIKAMLKNPRKHALREYNNFVLELENKSLLKRISSILTAPPQITDKQYQEMKKMCVTEGRGLKAQYEKKLADKKSEEFFNQLKKMKAYYNHKQWEEEYERQKFNQQFMSQVKYRRPKGYVDKHVLEEKKKAEEEAKRQRNKGAAAHIDRIREYKKINKEKRLNGLGSSVGSISTTSTSRSPRNSRGDRHGRAGNSGGGSHNGDTNEYDDDFYTSENGHETGQNSRGNTGHGNNNNHNNNHHHHQHNAGNHSGRDGGEKRIAFQDDNYRRSEDDGEEENENRVPLASTSRIIKLTREVTMNNFEEGGIGIIGNLAPQVNENIVEENMYLNAQIECFLINRDFLIVTAVCYMGEDTLEAEAEINSEELAAISGGELKQASNLTLLSEIAQEVVDNVEVKVDANADVRLVLNLLSDALSTDNDPADPNLWNMSAMSSSQITNNEEITSILLPDRVARVYSCGLHITVSFLVHASHSIGNFNMLVNLAKQQSRTENIYALVKISNTGDDQLLVNVFFVQNTLERYKKGSRVIRPAVVAGTSCKLYVSMPSIVQADPEMILSFAENLAQNVKVEHDCRTGENTLVISS